MDWARADGGGEPQRLLTSRLPVIPGDISAAGDLVYVQGQSGYDIWTLRLDLADPERPKAGAPVPFLVSPANELQPVLYPPDGKWLAYVLRMRAHRAAWSWSGRSQPPAPRRSAVGRYPVRGRRIFRCGRATGELFYSRYMTAEPTVREIVKVPYRVSGDTFVADKPTLWSKQSHLDLDQFRVWMRLQMAAASSPCLVSTPPECNAGVRTSRCC